MEVNVVYNEDCMEGLKKLEKESVDSIVTDPPYNLKFMGKSWDDKGTPKQFQEWNEKWAKLAYDVLKPGGYLVVFSGTKTYHRMVSGVEDAGFEVKDMIEWMYGTGFPKSYNISKGFDKQAGVEREVVGKKERNGSAYMKEQEHWQQENGRAIDGRDSEKIKKRVEKMKKEGVPITKPATDEAKKWEGWGTALKPAHEPILLAQKPREGTYCNNVEKYGCGAINIDECRASHDEPVKKTNRQKDKGNTWNSSNSGLRDNPTKIASPSQKGRFPANLVLTHHPDCEYKGRREVKSSIAKDKPSISNNIFPGTGKEVGYGDNNGMEIISNWKCHPSCPVKAIDEQSGVSISSGGSGKASQKTAPNDIYGEYEKGYKSDGLGGYGDKGGASRYFNQFHFIEDDFFKYTPKASKSERTCNGKIENNHPTVKPIELLEWLVKLVTPKDGIVVDPFGGSGTTFIASIKSDINYIGFELEEEYYNIILKRIAQFDPSYYAKIPKEVEIKEQAKNKKPKQNKLI